MAEPSPQRRRYLQSLIEEKARMISRESAPKAPTTRLNTYKGLSTAARYLKEQ